MTRLKKFTQWGFESKGPKLQGSKVLSHEPKHPIILDGKNQVETLLNVLKQRFYIIKIRPVVKKIFYECGYCSRRFFLPKLPQMADLPEFRMTAYVSPFAHTGLDFFGPMLEGGRENDGAQYLRALSAGLFTRCIPVN
jgi:hypothetical protein